MDVSDGPKGKPHQKGIYKVDGDTLTSVAWRRTGRTRPTAFESPAGSKAVLITLMRVKKD